jgi:nucleoid-associated protein YgaU
VTTPLSMVTLGLVEARLEILWPRPRTPEDGIIRFRFNPSEYQLQKANNFAELAIPGLEAPPLQFVRGGTEKLTTELLVDTSDTLEDVRKKYTDRLRSLMKLNNEHAPPIVKLIWDTDVFTGVVESMGVTFTLFTPQGVPLRAKVSLSLKEYRNLKEQAAENKAGSPTVDKGWTVRRGDTLASIAADVYQDPARWREIARANQIEDPRTLAPGRLLDIPRLF